MQITAQFLWLTDDGRPEWLARHYVSSVDLSTPRPRVFVGMYPCECTADLSDLTQALRWAMVVQPRILAFRIEAGGMMHVEAQEAAA